MSQPPKTERIELRTDPDREKRIRYAAELEEKSISSFVLGAAAERAEAVIASSSRTTVPSDYFDELWSALAEAPQPSPAFVRRSASERHVEQR